MEKILKELGYNGDFTSHDLWDWFRINKGINIESIDDSDNDIDNTLKEMVELSFKISLVTGQYLFGWNKPSYNYKFIGHGDNYNKYDPKFEGYSVLYEYIDEYDDKPHKKTINYSFEQVNEYIAYKRDLQLNKIIN